MPNKKPIHTVPTQKGWANKQGGVVTSNHRTKAAAQAEGRRQAKSQSTEHAVHNKMDKLESRIVMEMTRIHQETKTGN